MCPEFIFVYSLIFRLVVCSGTALKQRNVKSAYRNYLINYVGILSGVDKMNTFKKLAIVFIAFSLFVLCSCSNPDSAAPTYISATYERNISGSDVFNNGWYYEALDIHTKVKVSNYEPTKGVTWSVYFTEEKLTEEEIEKLKEREPDIINSGEINASKYAYIYVYCDHNSTNSVAPTTDMLKISYKTQ